MALLVEGQMDCISVFAAGVTPVLATSGTAFTEQQARLLRRYTTRVVVNFDPDTAGTTAAEKSIALLTEEGFEVRVVTLEGGLDPDRFVRERGVQAYAEALKSAVRHSEYLIERARKLFPVRTAQGKVEAVNFLLPHIRRMPDVIAKVEFAKDIGDKLGIDAALLRDKLKQATGQRQAQIPAMKVSNLSECERVLVRALAGSLESETFCRAAEAMTTQAEHFEGLGIVTTLEELARRQQPDPLEAASDQGRGMVAQLLMRESEPVTRHELESALMTLEQHSIERRQRRLRSAIAEMERRGDLAGVTALITERMELDRRLRELDRQLRELLGKE
jgi:DNA primase